MQHLYPRLGNLHGLLLIETVAKFVNFNSLTLSWWVVLFIMLDWAERTMGFLKCTKNCFLIAQFLVKVFACQAESILRVSLDLALRLEVRKYT